MIRSLALILTYQLIYRVFSTTLYRCYHLLARFDETKDLSQAAG